MAVVVLDFVPPEYPGFTSLEIFESATEVGAPGALIETVAIDPNNYITRYATQFAADQNDWFSIRWVGPAGDRTEYSSPLQGGTSTLVGEIVNRVMLRDPQLDENVVVQAAEYVISQVMNTEDVYSLLKGSATYAELEGLTLLTMARSYVSMMGSTSDSQSYVAGLVSQKSESDWKDNQGLIDWLLKQGNAALGLNYSWVFLMNDIDPTGLGTISTINYDQSRLAVTLEIE